MNQRIFTRRLVGRMGQIMTLILLTFVLKACREEPQIWDVSSTEQVISEFVSSRPDEYSEFNKLIDLSGMRALLSIRGPYTLFLPTDDAMFDYYVEQNIDGLEDLNETQLEELILTHLVPAAIGSNDIGLGAVREPNALGDFLPSEFDGADIIIAKRALITNRDILASNGFIHQIDAAIDPVEEDIFTVVQSNPSYSIFAEGLERVGLKDTLSIISFPYGQKVARTRFTILAVADSIYQRNGINNVDDLIQWTGANPDSITHISNPFYRYMEYHCLTGSYYLSDLETGVYPILSRDNNVAVRIEDDYMLNFDRETEEYTGFIIKYSNTPAKNGAVHSIDDLLPAIEAEPARVLFETTDFFDVKQGDYYVSYYKRFFDGENTFAKIKWEGDYLLYYYKSVHNEIIASDCLSMQGWWSLSVTFPKVMKGAYEVYIMQPGWGDITDAAVYVDGEPMKNIYTGPFGTGSGGLQKVGEVEFDKTEEHTVTLRNVSAGMVFWDYVEFVPIDN